MKNHTKNCQKFILDLEQILDLSLVSYGVVIIDFFLLFYFRDKLVIIDLVCILIYLN